MPRLRQIESFVSAATRGSLSAAAQAEGVAPAIIGRRIDALEARLGVRLMVRTTRRLTLTAEGAAFLEHGQRLLDDLHNAEASVSLGGQRARGHLRVSAPAGFGRAHVAPLLPAFIDAHPEVSITLDLSDRLVDIVAEGFDLAVRIGALEDSRMVGIRLADNRRVVVCSPDYLERHGAPKHPTELQSHECLGFGPFGGQARGWQFLVDGKPVAVRVAGKLQCNDGAVLHDWACAGRGLAWRSMWEVGDDVAAGRLITVLDEYAAPGPAIHVVMAGRRQLPLRVRAFVDHLKSHYANPDYWRLAPPPSAQ